MFGSPLPGDIGDEDIGSSLIRGARQGSANITQRAQDEQNQLATDIGTKTPVDARGVYRGSAGYEAARLQMDPSVYPAYAARLDNIRQMAIEAQHPFFQQFWGQLAAGEVPYARFQELRSNLGADLPGYSGMTKGQQDQLYEAMTDAMRDAAFQRGGQALADKFDNANANYKSLIGAGGQREQLEAIGGRPQSGGWDQFFGPQGQTEPALGVDFTGGKGEGQAATWLNSNLRSPEKLAPFANPTIVPNEFWRQVVGQWLATRGQTPEGTFRPDQMARQWGGDDSAANKGVGGDVKTQLFSTPERLRPAATFRTWTIWRRLGRNAVVAINRSGLTDTAGSVFALKWLADKAQDAFGTSGGLSAMASAVEACRTPHSSTRYAVRARPSSTASIRACPPRPRTFSNIRTTRRPCMTRWATASPRARTHRNDNRVQPASDQPDLERTRRAQRQAAGRRRRDRRHHGRERRWHRPTGVQC